MIVISNLFFEHNLPGNPPLATLRPCYIFFVLELASSCGLEIFYIRALPHPPGARKKKGSD